MDRFLPPAAAFICLALTASPLPVGAGSLTLTPLARHATGLFDQGAAEIPAWHAASRRLFVVNGAANTIDILTFDGQELRPAGALALGRDEAPTSVAVNGDRVAVAAYDPQSPDWAGKIILFSPDGRRVGEFAAGSMPDMVTFTPDGRHVLSADEGERNGAIDPEGSVTIVDLADGITNAVVRRAGFRAFDAGELKARGVRIFPDAESAGQDLEPEYIAVSPDGRRAFVTLQENNAVAVVDIPAARVTDIWPLGVKDHMLPGNGLDASRKNGVRIANYPVFGLYMPDSIAAVTVAGETFLVTANEGDARKEDVKLGKARLAPGAVPPELLDDLAELEISAMDGDDDGDGRIERPHSYGARSFSIWSAEDGSLIHDSGDDFERITAERLGAAFNADNASAGSGDKRSPKKGPEPEGVAVGEMAGRIYAFIGLERMGGIMVYDVTEPRTPTFVAYQLDRNLDSTFDYERPADLARAGDLGPEGLLFVPGAESPTGAPLLIVANEVSGTVTVYAVTANR